MTGIEEIYIGVVIVAFIVFAVAVARANNASARYRANH